MTTWQLKLYIGTFAEKRWNLGVDFSAYLQSEVNFLLIFHKNKIVTGKDDILWTNFVDIKGIYYWMLHTLPRNSHVIFANAIIFAMITAIKCFIWVFKIWNARNWKFWKFEVDFSNFLTLHHEFANVELKNILQNLANKNAKCM